MNRRLKDRLPPILTATQHCAPRLVLMVTASIVVTPQAMAQIQANNVVPAWTSYSKADLEKPMPANPVTSLEGRVLTEVNELFRRMTAAQSDPLKALAVAEPDKKTTLIQIAALKGEPVRPPANPDAIRTLLAGELQKAGSNQAKNLVKFIERFNSGLGFSLNLASLFGGAAEKNAPKAGGSVRYGLVLEEITPDPNAPHRAAIGDVNSELTFAGHADVKWSIGPISEEQGRRLFHVSESDEIGAHGLKNYLPKPGFKGKVVPENFENLAKVNQENMPAWRLDVSQEQGLYNLIYRVKPTGEKISEEHQFFAPIPLSPGDIKVGRRFNDKWEVVQTSAYNVLIDKRLPLISVHKMHIEERLSADATYVVDGHSISISARGAAKGVIADEATRPEAYSLNYGKSF